MLECVRRDGAEFGVEFERRRVWQTGIAVLFEVSAQGRIYGIFADVFTYAYKAMAPLR